MIRIRLKSGKSFKMLEELHLQGMTGDGRSYKISKKLGTLSGSNDGCKKVYDYLNENLKEVIVGCPVKLSKIVEDIENLIHSAPINRTICFDKLKKVFNYDNFTTKGRKWGAYTLTEYLQCTVCPYCNRNFTTFIDNLTRPQLDHFFLQSEYPYLAFSLYNLIPSCSICNSILRGNIPFTLSSNIHPYISDFEDKMRFTLSPREGKTKEFIISHFNSDEGDFGIDFESGSPMKPSHKQKIENNIGIFALKELYNTHKGYAKEILKKNIIYKPEIVNQLFQEVGLSAFEDRYQLLFGNYWEKEDFGLRPLSKFSRDIYLYCHPNDQN